MVRRHLQLWLFDFDSDSGVVAEDANATQTQQWHWHCQWPMAITTCWKRTLHSWFSLRLEEEGRNYDNYDNEDEDGENDEDDEKRDNARPPPDVNQNQNVILVSSVSRTKENQEAMLQFVHKPSLLFFLSWWWRRLIDSFNSLGEGNPVVILNFGKLAGCGRRETSWSIL